MSIPANVGSGFNSLYDLELCDKSTFGFGYNKCMQWMRIGLKYGAIDINN